MKLRDLIPVNALNELDFKHQSSFDAYRKQHDMRPDTKVTIAGKATTVGDASKKPGLLQKLGSKLFGKSEPEVEMPKDLDPKNPLNKLKIFDPKRGADISVGKAIQDPKKYKHLAAKVQSLIDTDPTGELAKKTIDAEKKKSKERAIRKKEFDAKKAEKRKENEKWRQDNPELAKKKDAENAEKRRKEAEEQEAEDLRQLQKIAAGDYDYDNPSDFADKLLKKSIEKYLTKDKDDDKNDDSFGGGSFGGAGAGSSW
jgi:hypothetical protein